MGAGLGLSLRDGARIGQFGGPPDLIVTSPAPQRAGKLALRDAGRSTGERESSPRWGVARLRRALTFIIARTTRNTTMDSRALEVLEANEAFYRAFAERDADGMERIWALRHPVACIHPGWDVLDSRAEVVASWRRILESGSAPEISASLAEARLLGDVALVTCHERFADAVLAATNVFLREDGAWKMVHHQATPIAPGQERPATPTGRAN